MRKGKFTQTLFANALGVISISQSDAEIPLLLNSLECIFARHKACGSGTLGLPACCGSARVPLLADKRIPDYIEQVRQSILKEQRLSTDEYRKKFVAPTAGERGAGIS